MIGGKKAYAAANLVMSDAPLPRLPVDGVIMSASERNADSRGKRTLPGYSAAPPSSSRLHNPSSAAINSAALHVPGPRGSSNRAGPPSAHVHSAAAAGKVTATGMLRGTAPPPVSRPAVHRGQPYSISPKSGTLPLSFVSGLKARKKHICARCLTQLGRFFNTGSPCPSCGERICSNCRIRVYLPKKTWLCTLCVQERQLRLTTGDWTLKRTEILMRAPMSIAAEAEIRTLPRKGKMMGLSQVPLAPLSSSSFSPATLLRPSTLLRPLSKTGPVNVSTVPAIDPAESQYYTATRGRPVTTFTSPITRKKVIKRKDRRNTVEVVTVPAAQLDTYLEEMPVKNSTLVRKIKSEAKLNALKSPVVKEKFEHVTITSTSQQVSRTLVSYSPQGIRKPRDGMDFHPRMMGDHSLPSQPAVFRAPSPPPPRTETPTDPLAATLPRAHKKVHRDESLLSTYSHIRSSEEPLDPGQVQQSLSVLSANTRKITANNRAGIRHPSYAGSIDRSVFSRVDTRRRSFTPRSSMRRSLRDTSYEYDAYSTSTLDDPLLREIVGAVILEYDDFLSVVKGMLQEVAVYWMQLLTFQQAGDQLHVSIIEIMPNNRVACGEAADQGFPQERSNVFHVTEQRHPQPVEVILQEPAADSPPRLSRKNSMRRFSGRTFILPVVPLEPPPHFRDTERSEVMLLDSDNDLLSESSTDISDAVQLDPRPLIHTLSIETQPEPLPVKPARRKSKEKSAALLEMAHSRENRMEVVPVVPDHPVIEDRPELVGNGVSHEFNGVSVVNAEPEVIPVVSVEIISVEPPPAEERYTDHLIKPKPRRKSREALSEALVEPGFLNGLPKLRETPKIQKTIPDEEIPEFQRVRERLRDVRVPEKTAARSDDEDLDDVRKVSSAMQHFKKINQEVQDLKEFLKLVRNGTGSLAQDDVPVESTPEVPKTVEPAPEVVESPPEVAMTPEDLALDDLDAVLDAETKRPPSAVVSPVSDGEIQLHDAFHDSGRFSEPETGEGVPAAEEVVVKKCVPVQRPALLTQESSEAEDELERESNSSVVSEDMLPVRKAKKVEVTLDSDEERDLHSPEDVDVWELEAVQQMQQDVDYFGRLQVPLYTIEEESEDDEDRETAFTRLTNYRLRHTRMFSVDSVSSEEPESDAELHDHEPHRANASHLEQYFITGLLQPAGAKKQPYFRADMDLDALEEDELIEPKGDVGQPSIFKAARLNFASADYRLSSDNDMDDDLSDNNSDDESLYY